MIGDHHPSLTLWSESVSPLKWHGAVNILYFREIGRIVARIKQTFNRCSVCKQNDNHIVDNSLYHCSNSAEDSKAVILV